MQSDDNLIELAINSLNDGGNCILSSTVERFDLPWDILAYEFLQYAEKDIAGKEPHHLINALSNVKRAMECQVDSLLLIFGMCHHAKKQRWGVPKKLEILNEMGVIAPRVLSKINRERNLLEHEYALPNETEVTDFVDIVALFIASTQLIIEQYHIDPLVGKDDLDQSSSPAVSTYRVNTEEGLISLNI